METKPIMIYMAGPCFDHTGDYRSQEARTWRRDLAREAPFDVLLFSPPHAFFGASPITAPLLDAAERAMIHQSHGLLAWLPEGIPAFGTIRDIEVARLMGKPVVVVGRVESLMAHDVYQEPSLGEGLLRLVEAVRQQQSQPALFLLPGFVVRQDESDDD